jgi:hypothetical protein
MPQLWAIIHPPANDLTDWLTRHLAAHDLTAILMKVGRQVQPYVMLDGCVGCARNACQAGCPSLALREAFGDGRLRLVPRGLAQRRYCQRVLAVPDRQAQPLDLALLHHWQEARLLVRYAPGGKTRALLWVGEGETRAMAALREWGWRGIVIPGWFPCWKGTQGMPPRLPIGRPAPFAPTLFLPEAQEETTNQTPLPETQKWATAQLPASQWTATDAPPEPEDWEAGGSDDDPLASLFALGGDDDEEPPALAFPGGDEGEADYSVAAEADQPAASRNGTEEPASEPADPFATLFAGSSDSDPDDPTMSVPEASRGVSAAPDDPFATLFAGSDGDPDDGHHSPVPAGNADPFATLLTSSEAPEQGRQTLTSDPFAAAVQELLAERQQQIARAQQVAASPETDEDEEEGKE